MEKKQIGDLRNRIIKEIENRNYDSLRYVLFDKENKLPFAVHLYEENDNFFVNSRDDRSYVIGKTFEFKNFEDAKGKFLNILELTVKINKNNKKLGYQTDYSSPLWDDVSDN